MNLKKGFTLIEIVVVLAIIGILAVALSTTFVSSLRKGIDARRKTDLKNVQQALELYYSDNNAYPLTLPTPTGSLCYPGGSGPDCTKALYLKQMPADPKGSGYQYTYVSDGTQYQLYSCLDNAADTGPGTGTYTANCGSSCNNCKFGVSSSNTSP